MQRTQSATDDALDEGVRGHDLRGHALIALLGRTYDRLAQRVGQATAGAIVLAIAAGVWLVLAWILGDG